LISNFCLRVANILSWAQSDSVKSATGSQIGRAMRLAVDASLRCCNQLCGAYWVLFWALNMHPNLRSDKDTLTAISRLVQKAWDSKFPESVVMWDMLNTLGIRVDVDLNSFKPYQLPVGLSSSRVFDTQVEHRNPQSKSSEFSFPSLPADALMEILTQCGSESGA
jgi:hypothetical protein